VVGDALDCPKIDHPVGAGPDADSGKTKPKCRWSILTGEPPLERVEFPSKDGDWANTGSPGSIVED
jgi:hypothetical protein